MTNEHDTVPIDKESNELEVKTEQSELTQALLDSLNVEQERDSNRKNLDSIGGIDSLLERCAVDPHKGFTDAQVDAMREKFGNNKFPETPMDSYLSLLLEALSDGTLLILIAAATVSLIIGVTTHDPSSGWIEGGAIFIAIFLVSNISAANDYTKQLQFRALEATSSKDQRCSVVREGEVKRINPDDLVVGDIIFLQAGDMIPADCILLDKNTILTNESSLTGEPDDLKKNRNKDCFLLSSCLFTEGEDCHALVIGIGVHSQWGKIKANLATASVNTPLQDKLEIMATRVGYIGMFFAILTFIALVVRIWFGNGGGQPNNTQIMNGIVNAFIIAVTVVVVAIPEGLPLAVTIALAYSTKKMYSDQCFIRILAACETMGNATNICSDKTGTLTENRMTVVEGLFGDTIYDQDEFSNATINSTVKKFIVEQVSLNRSAYLIYKDPDGKVLDRPTIIGNKTEGALMLMIRNWGENYEEIHQECFNEKTDKLFSFNSAKKRSTCVVQTKSGSWRIYVKGASEWILKDCTHMTDSTGRPVPISSEKRQKLEAHILSMADNALRTLCLAHKEMAALPYGWEENPPDSSDLVLDCIVGIIDPLRPDVKEAVRIAQEAGVVVRMVTGDNIATACAIARQCGILTPGGLAVEGPKFRNMTPKEVDSLLPRLQVMARSSPEDKFLLVTRLNGFGIPSNQEEWEKKFKGRPGVTWDEHRDALLPGHLEEWQAVRPEGGQVVGVTGDGTNDAPALKAADVGLAMGITGTKVAQSAADIVILDDKFSSIVKAISWGRCVYDSIRKFLQFQLTVNLVALLLVFIGALTGFEPPLNAVQLLWVNLVMDTMGALALGTDAPTKALLQRKPYKRSASLISRPMVRHIMTQGFFQLILLLVLLYEGARWFDVPQGNGCARYKVANKDISWSVLSGKKITEGPGDITCAGFRDYCFGQNELCLQRQHWIEVNDAVSGDSSMVAFKFKDLDNFADDCLTCTKLDYSHYSIIFNTFIWCQIFNEFSSRNLFNELNMFRGLHQNPVFIAVCIITIGFQILLIEKGGEFLKTTPLTLNEWLITIALGAITIPIGILMRFIPVTEDPKCFFDNGTAEAIAESTTEKEKEKDGFNL